MADILIRRDRRAGRITLTRPQALNALNHDMALAIDAALKAWQHDPEIALVIIDAEGQGTEARVQVNFGNQGVKWLAVAVAKLHAA